MSDPLITRMPPLANDWVVGLASGAVFDEAAVAQLARALAEDDVVATDELLRAAVGAVEAANSSYFRFDLETAIDEHEPRVVELTPSSDSRAAGLGLRRDASTRKIVALVVLEVRGGTAELSLDGQDNAIEVAAGAIVMFPAYCTGRITGPADVEVAAAAFHAFGRAFR